ncbi:MAG: 4-hydroxy-3-methylbut-2-enyl diphosphate reductase [Treponema sp.]|jgi:4-hydroxy-3-methylbut-2-enyl diphosphate reductase|nr:4-hydroxy-3-methylbut-2-enyl diphosphate reductase [Treponema sp.]
MTVIRAKVLGFCAGVRRAVDLAVCEAGRAGTERARRVYTLGPLIHNPKVSADLYSLGVETADALPDDGENASIIIRTHGVSPDVENRLKNSAFRIIDATCPNVKASQLKTREFSRAGYCLFLAGEAGHAEIAGIRGYAEGGFCFVVCGADEAREKAAALFETNKGAKTALIAQTTISEEEYYSISAAIKEYFPLLETVNTICAAAKDRQNALRGLLDHVDAVIIAGGRQSSNTRRLLAAAQESGKPCALCESAADIPRGYFSDFETIGLCAGASTPDAVIDEIEQALQRK